MKYVYRDDDIRYSTELAHLQEVHQLFVKYGRVHTLTMLMYGMEARPDLVKYILSQPRMELQLHGWEHVSYPEMTEHDIRQHLEQSMKSFQKLLNCRPKIWYLPWNGWVHGKGETLVPRVARIAKDYGLKVDIECASIRHFIPGRLGMEKYSEQAKAQTIYFHCWDKEERSLVEQMLQLTIKPYDDQYISK